MGATLVLLRREIKKWVGRRPVFVMSMITPLIWLALFGKSLNLYSMFNLEQPGFAELIQRIVEQRVLELFGTLDYFTYLASGMLVVFALFQSAFGGVGIVFDKRLGYMTRLLVSPIPRASIFIAKIMGTLFRISVLSVVLFAAALALGFQVKQGITLLDLAAAGAVILLLSLGLASIYATMAFYANNHEVLFAAMNLINLPLMFTSSAIFPREQMPSWLQAIATVNPITHAADLVRYHLIGRPVNSYMHSLGLLAAFSLILFLAGMALSLRSLKESR